MGTAFPYLFWPLERRSHGYFEGNVQILCVRRALQMSLTTDYPTIPTLSHTYFKLKHRAAYDNQSKKQKET
jgi:hypothetical protein